MHLNGEAVLARNHDADLFLGAILEGRPIGRSGPLQRYFTRRSSGDRRRSRA
jgi:hypothetical protein